MYLEGSVMRGWEFLTGDVDFKEYGGKWYRQVGPERYHVIELINWHEATGEQGDKYCVQLMEVDLEWVDVDAAVGGMGYRDDVDLDDPVVQVEAVTSYGNYAPMGNWNGNNYRKLLRMAKKESKALDDHDYHSQQMHNRPVNAMGSTAFEMARGDFTSAIVRGLAKGDPNARIIGKIEGYSPEDMDKIGPEHKDFTLSPTLNKGE